MSADGSAALRLNDPLDPLSPTLCSGFYNGTNAITGIAEETGSAYLRRPSKGRALTNAPNLAFGHSAAPDFDQLLLRRRQLTSHRISWSRTPAIAGLPDHRRGGDTATRAFAPPARMSTGSLTHRR